MVGKGEGKGLSIPCGSLTMESRKALRKAPCVCHLSFPVQGVRGSPVHQFAPLASQLPFLTSSPVKALVLISSNSQADFLRNGP